MKFILSGMCLCLLILFPSVLKAQSSTQITDTQAFRQFSDVDATPGKLHVAYDNTIDNANEEVQDIFYQQSIDQGKTYLPAVKVSQSGGINFSPDIKVSPKGFIYIVWSGISNQARTIFISRSTDDGKTFSTPQAISLQNQLAQIPKVNISTKGVIFVTYFDGNGPGSIVGTYVTQLKESTFSVTKKPQLVSNSGAFSSRADVLFDSKKNVYIAYGDANTGISYLVTSNNKGKTFNTAVPVSTGSPRFATDTVAIIDSQDNIYLSANTGDAGNFSIYFTKSTDSGKTFSRPLIIPNSSGGIGPALAISGNSLIVSWSDGGRISFSQSLDGGTTFGKKNTIPATTAGFSFNVSASASGEGTFLSWVSRINETDDTTQVFSAKVQ